MAEDQNTKKPTARFNYRRSNSFRVIKAEGAWGGVTPKGEIVMNIFNERLPIPNYDELEILEDGTYGNRVDFQVEARGVVREVEVALNMDVQTANTLAHWLLDKVRTVEQALGTTLEEMEAEGMRLVTSRREKKNE